MAASSANVGASASSSADAAQARLQARKPRKCFNTLDDLCLLREVAATRPFGDELKWVSVLASVNRAVGRELTLRGIKDRVDLLIGYWRRQDAKNLKKSGTEEQYTEKDQILQDLSDYARAVQYEPRITPRSAGCAVRKKRPATAHDARTSRAAQQPNGASHLEEEVAGDCSYSAAPASQICIDGEKDGKFL
ncbi:hypothetical protein V5799_013154 [Amblyomma americanum]|uniref:Uncharacterized protein n=1 Tax=Amblyomma americanum TaxID=6943 RepID=A0AAQ4E6V2_AMBAM